MNDPQWLAIEAQRTFRRLLPQIEALIEDEGEATVFIARLRRHFPRIFSLLYPLYGDQYDFFYHLQQIVGAAARLYAQRPADLKALDNLRERNPQWFQSEQMMGATLYVDLFAGDLKAMHEHIGYLKELGITYLHLMPLFRTPAGENDGGYAVSNYRNVRADLGTMADLNALAAALRREGISLVVDFVFNHTSDEHEWAVRALSGDEEYQAFYHMFPDRTLPDRYEQSLREIFPEQAPGSFTYRREIDKWVWTTFHHYQWDLNYHNPAVFCAMLEEMLFLANQGVEVLRLDALAFIWKQMGTTCENLPGAHAVIRAYNALVSVAAPAMVFKSEAIVHPDHVASYIGGEECPISYNPTLMALLWEALATRDVKMLQHAMARRYAIPDDCAWVNYVRVHDDIGWSFADEDAAELGINGFDHRQFLNQFYTGRFSGSFAMGVPFNYNPVTHDMRISGTAASLAGLEEAIKQDNALYGKHALRRLLLLHSVILSAGGIPLLYMGDEMAPLNDYSYTQDPARARDSRWVHRPRFDWNRADRRNDTSTYAGQIFQGLKRLIALRKATPALATSRADFIASGSPHVLAYVRGGTVLVLANFSEREQKVALKHFAPAWDASQGAVDLVSGLPLSGNGSITLEPYQFVWLSVG